MAKATITIEDIDHGTLDFGIVFDPKIPVKMAHYENYTDAQVLGMELVNYAKKICMRTDKSKVDVTVETN